MFHAAPIKKRNHWKSTTHYDLSIFFYLLFLFPNAHNVQQQIHLGRPSISQPNPRINHRLPPSKPAPAHKCNAALEGLRSGQLPRSRRNNSLMRALLLRLMTFREESRALFAPKVRAFQRFFFLYIVPTARVLWMRVSSRCSPQGNTYTFVCGLGEDARMYICIGGVYAPDGGVWNASVLILRWVPKWLLIRYICGVSWGIERFNEKR